MFKFHLYTGSREWQVFHRVQSPRRGQWCVPFQHRGKPGHPRCRVLRAFGKYTSVKTQSPWKRNENHSHSIWFWIGSLETFSVCFRKMTSWRPSHLAWWKETCWSLGGSWNPGVKRRFLYPFKIATVFLYKHFFTYGYIEIIFKTGLALVSYPCEINSICVSENCGPVNKWPSLWRSSITLWPFLVLS